MFQISFIASCEQTRAGTINTIRAVHLSPVADRAALRGGETKSMYGRRQGGVRRLSPGESQNTHLCFLRARSASVGTRWERVYADMCCSKNVIDFTALAGVRKKHRRGLRRRPPQLLDREMPY